jgi:hypothetical protein
MSVSNENKELLCYTCETKLLHHDNIIDGVAEFGYLLCSLCYSKFCCIECGSGHSKATDDYYCQDCEESSSDESESDDLPTDKEICDKQIATILKLYKMDRPLPKHIKEDIDRVLENIGWSCWFADWINHRIYCWVLEINANLNKPDLVEFIYWEDINDSDSESDESESDCSSIHSDHSIEVNKVIELIHSVPCRLECDTYSGCEIGGMTDEELENFKIEILMEIERYKLLKEFYRLEKMSPKAMIELNKKYDKKITEYSNEEIRDIVIEIIEFNMENYGK